MPSDVEIEKLSAAAQKVLGPAAPAPVRLMAARGVMPGLKPAEIVTVISVLCDAEDAKVRETADATLGKLPPPILSGALMADLPGSVIERLARVLTTNADAVAGLIKMPRVTASALEFLAGGADEKCGEIIATNEQLMLAHPTVIEKLYMNKRVRMSTADRLIELAVRNNIELQIPAFKEAAAAIKNELIAEPSDEETFDDVLFKQTEDISHATDVDDKEPDVCETDEEGEERLREKFLPLHAQIAQMTVTQKIRRAMLGNAAERLLLVRDSNRLVATAAVKSPLMRENEAVQISASRSVSEDVLRTIALNREFTRSYQVKLNLVMNPRTPFTFSSRLIPHLRDNDLRALSKSKNVPGAIAQAVRAQLARKKPGK